ncbi:MAG: sensor histidine kinase [Anaerovoracaceae bacterium]
MIRLFLDYLKSHIRILIVYIISITIFLIVLYLYRVNVDGAIYGGILCLVILIPFGIYDFYRFCKCHFELLTLKNKEKMDFTSLSDPITIIEKDYRDLLKNLDLDKNEAESKAYMGRQEMLNYFTLWAHQIKTPISAMGLILQTKEEKTKEDEQIKIQLFNIEEYVNTLMSYIRMGDISSDLAFEEVNLGEVVKETIKKYAPIFIGKKIKVNFENTREIAITDPKWAGIVLAQILSNGLKYTPDNGEITIRIQKQKIIVKDTGIGIKEEDLPRIFEKGFTGYNGRQFTKSTGQGLYLCQVIMDKLSHKIQITSKIDQGTTVILDFSKESFQ